MKKAIEKIKEEYQKLCDKYNLTMDNYENIQDLADLAVNFKDAFEKQKSNKRELTIDGMISIVGYIMYCGLVIMNLSAPTIVSVGGLTLLYLLIISIIFSSDTIGAIVDNSKYKKVSKEFIESCNKTEDGKYITKLTALDYANLIIEERNQYKVEAEDILPTIITIEKILNSFDPVQAIFEYGESCPIVKEALKEEWNSYLKECEKVRPHNIRLTTNEITPDTYIRVPEAKPKKLLYGSKEKIKINK